MNPTVDLFNFKAKERQEEMKKLYLFILITVFTGYAVSAQNNDFEGIITYKLEYGANTDPAKAAQLKYMFGDSVRLYIKGNNYKQHYVNSKWLQEATYLGATNKFYMVFQKFDTVYSVDCSRADDKYEIRAYPYEQQAVLNHNCGQLVLMGERSLRTFYYALDMQLARPDFSAHKIGGFDLYMSKAKAPYLYQRIQNESGIQELKAVNISREELPDKVFELLPLPVK